MLIATQSIRLPVSGEGENFSRPDPCCLEDELPPTRLQRTTLGEPAYHPIIDLQLPIVQGNAQGPSILVFKGEGAGLRRNRDDVIPNHPSGFVVEQLAEKCD